MSNHLFTYLLTLKHIKTIDIRHLTRNLNKYLLTYSTKYDYLVVLCFENTFSILCLLTACKYVNSRTFRKMYLLINLLTWVIVISKCYIHIYIYSFVLLFRHWHSHFSKTGVGWEGAPLN